MKTQNPFDTTELEREIEHECDFNNGSVGCKVCIKDERQRIKAEVEKILDEAKQTSGFVGIGEWTDDRDLDLFFEFIEKLKQKLGLLQEKK